MATKRNGFEKEFEMVEPVMCPFCGAAELLEEEGTDLETDEEYWVIYRWVCADCGESFEKIVARPLSEAFEDADDEDGPVWS